MMTLGGWMVVMVGEGKLGEGGGERGGGGGG
jgi:hypothetical protein